MNFLFLSLPWRAKLKWDKRESKGDAGVYQNTKARGGGSIQRLLYSYNLYSDDVICTLISKMKLEMCVVYIYIYMYIFIEAF